ncbi:ABC transporter permease [Amycolatopsis cihanbeyliensis]|uniref:ABC-2 type transport system permease protein n=1 Tax=Amycolatopsis cihanbeyliensis TaxID=1128664 RepID=A0A542DMH6_AMYCI|nr:ABC transporter permease [Amycolatopsis cihanbeyliensis]TQJ04185.1 ABC-2 type transport system permease protein [Amycolatopsis cihanbeyliensis]
MHATSTVHPVDTAAGTPSKPAPDRRSFARAFADLRTGFRQRELWSHLGWQDIKQRYRRSVLGPLWITISMGITALGLGLLYSQLFDSEISTYLPYITVGFIVWHFLLGNLTEGTDTFIANEGLIKHLPAPLSVYVLRTVWRQSIMFVHNLIIYFVVLAIFWNGITEPGYTITDNGVPQPGLGWSAFLAIPGFALIAINAGWVVLLFGIASTRFRDIPQVVSSLINLMFFMTPIVWSTDILRDRFGESVGWRDLVAELNPLYHFIQIVRAPLIGNEQSWHHWVIVAGFAVVGWGLALLVMRNYRSRVSYWV